jgi:hypothetical protein
VSGVSEWRRWGEMERGGEKAKTEESARGGAGSLGWSNPQRGQETREQTKRTQGWAGQKRQKDHCGTTQCAPATAWSSQVSLNLLIVRSGNPIFRNRPPVAGWISAGSFGRAVERASVLVPLFVREKADRVENSRLLSSMLRSAPSLCAVFWWYAGAGA